jgi:peptide-methionine (R)-S-oxide reductase
MLSRRNLLLAGLSAGALAVVAFRATRSTAGSSPGTFEIAKTDEEWKKQLTPEQYHVLRKHGTERAFTSPLDKEYGAGSYACAGCDLPLFASQTKFDSRTGWPSFYRPLENAIGTPATATGACCAQSALPACGGHLGLCSTTARSRRACATA